MMAFFGPGDGRPELVAASRGLDGGQLVPEPVVTDDGVEVVRVIAVRSIPLNKVHPKLVSELRRRQFEAKYGGYLESLERRFDVKYGSAAIAALVDASKRGTTIPPEAFNLPLATYGAESSISLGEARRTLIARGFGRGSFADSADVVDAARRWVMADTLFLMAARAEGWLNDGVFAAETQMHYAKVMASLLHRRQVLAQVRNVEGDPHETLQRFVGDLHRWSAPQIPRPSGLAGGRDHGDASELTQRIVVTSGSRNRPRQCQRLSLILIKVIDCVA